MNSPNNILPLDDDDQAPYFNYEDVTPRNNGVVSTTGRNIPNRHANCH